MKSTKEIIEEMVAICELEGLYENVNDGCVPELHIVLDAVRASMKRTYYPPKMSKREDFIRETRGY